MIRTTIVNATRHFPIIHLFRLDDIVRATDSSCSVNQSILCQLVVTRLYWYVQVQQPDSWRFLFYADQMADNPFPIKRVFSLQITQPRG